MAARLTDDIFAALAEQTTVVTGTQAAEHIIGRLAAQLQQLNQQRVDVCDQLEIGQMSRNFQPVQRLVSDQKSDKNPASYPHACCVVLSS